MTLAYSTLNLKFNTWQVIEMRDTKFLDFDVSSIKVEDNMVFYLKDATVIVNRECVTIYYWDYILRSAIPNDLYELLPISVNFIMASPNTFDVYKHVINEEEITLDTIIALAKKCNQLPVEKLTPYVPKPAAGARKGNYLVTKCLGIDIKCAISGNLLCVTYSEKDNMMYVTLNYNSKYCIAAGRKFAAIRNSKIWALLMNNPQKVLDFEEFDDLGSDLLTCMDAADDDKDENEMDRIIKDLNI